MPPPADAFGSGKLGRPCERMQTENWRALSAFDPPVGAPVFCDAAFVVVLADGSCATPEDVGLLPQPAAVTARSVRAMRMRMRGMVRTPLRDGTFSRPARNSLAPVTTGERELLPACNRCRVIAFERGIRFAPSPRSSTADRA